MKIRKPSLECALLLACAFAVRAQDDIAPQTSGQGPLVIADGMKITPHAYAHFRAGQIVQGTRDKPLNGTYRFEHLWNEDATVGAALEAVYRDRLRMRFGIDGKLYFSYPILPVNGIVTKYLRQDFSFSDVFCTYAFAGRPDAPLLQVQTGYFPYKYNPDARNLGEYLFRTGTYPAYIIAHFDFASARLLGLRLNSVLFESLRQDLMFTTETFFFPTQNWSLSYIVNYDVLGAGLVEIGAGGSLSHLLSVYSTAFSEKFVGDPTTPEMTSNKQYIDENGDTVFYTFKGAKLMGRLSVDPKRLIPFDIFGEQDLRCYIEACCVGVRDYPDSSIIAGSSIKIEVPSYSDRMERTPVAFGFNLPAFKLLDVLNLEFEWFGSKYLNDASQVLSSSSVPLPVAIPDTNLVRESRWKWSLYARRSFLDGHFSITGQIARDHMRVPCASYNDEIWQEFLVQKGDWWWTLKTSWAF
jgi:hypothetical protein